MEMAMEIPLIRTEAEYQWYVNGCENLVVEYTIPNWQYHNFAWYEPVLRHLSFRNPRYVFVRVDAAQLKTAVSFLDIENLPGYCCFYRGVPMWRTEITKIVPFPYAFNYAYAGIINPPVHEVIEIRSMQLWLEISTAC